MVKNNCRCRQGSRILEPFPRSPRAHPDATTKAGCPANRHAGFIQVKAEQTAIEDQIKQLLGKVRAASSSRLGGLVW
jgi:hypothetical protein